MQYVSFQFALKEDRDVGNVLRIAKAEIVRIRFEVETEFPSSLSYFTRDMLHWDSWALEDLYFYVFCSEC